MNKEMKATALDKLGNLLKSMTVSDVRGGNVVLFAPVKISAAIAAESFDTREELDEFIAELNDAAKVAFGDVAKTVKFEPKTCINKDMTFDEILAASIQNQSSHE